MPRGVRVSRIIPPVGPGKPSKAKLPPTPGQAPLYNAKRRILSSRGLPNKGAPTPSFYALQEPWNESWRHHVSPDVSQFVDDCETIGHKLLPEDKIQLLQFPSRYFSRPQNVPKELRTQVYFPNLHVALKRSRFGPYYAQFEVGRSMNKLDFKNFLKEAYNVDVVHIRSFVTVAKMKRKIGAGSANGKPYRIPSKKRFIVQLVEPFEWPKKWEDMDQAPFDKTLFYKQSVAAQREGDKRGNFHNLLLDRQHRKSIAEQAQDLLAGKIEWAPTWKEMPNDVKVMGGYADAVPPSIPKSTSQVARR